MAIDCEYLSIPGKSDVDRFAKQIKKLFEWHTSGFNEFVAPYFPLIQSSGMGKTKLLVETRKHFERKTKDTTVFHFLCSARIGRNLNGGMIVWHNYIVNGPTDSECTRICLLLQSYLYNAEFHVIFMFDEAEALIREQDEFTF